MELSALYPARLNQVTPISEKCNSRSEINKYPQKNYRLNRVLSSKITMLLPGFDNARAIAFCDKYNKGLHQRSWPHKHGGNYDPGDLGHQSNFALSCMLRNTFNPYFEDNLVNSKSIDFRDNCLALADEICA